MAKNSTLKPVPGAVACKECRTKITVQDTSSIREEFSVKCEWCGFRGVYNQNKLR